MLERDYNQDVDLLKKKLQWRSRRSLLELDLILSKFIYGQNFNSLTIDDLFCYEDMLLWDDDYLLALFWKKEQHQNKDVNKIIDLIIEV